jgi:uncharacterized membrane protein YbaN (DUF454 family)
MSTSTNSRSSEANPAPGLGDAAPVPRGSWRDRVRRKPGIGQLYRVGVFVLGLAFIALGCAAVVLPGPWTIPPILLGLWVWSTEFSWAYRLFAHAKQKGQEAWAHAKQHPWSTAFVTIAGLVAIGVAIWAVYHWHLVARAEEAIGIG